MCYNSDSLVNYVENVNIIRIRFSEHINQIFKDV